MKTTKIINVDNGAWVRIRQRLPGISDSKRSKLIDMLFDDVLKTNLFDKLKPELTDTKQDKIMKKIVKEIFGK